VVYSTRRTEVVAGEIEGIRSFVEGTLLASPERAQRLFQSFLFNIDGYYNIPECRSWFQSIDRAYPYLIYFLSYLQYALYIGSQEGNDGGRLTIDAVWKFFRDRKHAIGTLAQTIGLPEDQVIKSFRIAFATYSGVELQTW
jgi:hypothetical protein